MVSMAKKLWVNFQTNNAKQTRRLVSTFPGFTDEIINSFLYFLRVKLKIHKLVCNVRAI